MLAPRKEGSTSQFQLGRWRSVFRLSALAVTLAVVCLGVVCAYFSLQGRPARGPRDPLLDKYDRIGSGTSLAEAKQFLGPPRATLRQGGSMGDTICWWKDDPGRVIVVTWTCGGQLLDKQFQDAPDPR